MVLWYPFPVMILWYFQYNTYTLNVLAATNEQGRLKSDAAECYIRSVSVLFVILLDILAILFIGR